MTLQFLSLVVFFRTVIGGDRWVEVSLRAFYPDAPALTEFSAVGVTSCATALPFDYDAAFSKLYPRAAPNFCVDTSRPVAGMNARPPARGSSGPSANWPTLGTPASLRSCQLGENATQAFTLVGAVSKLIEVNATQVGAPLCLSRLPLPGSNGSAPSELLGAAPCGAGADEWVRDPSSGLVALSSDTSMCLSPLGRNLTRQGELAMGTLAPLLRGAAAGGGIAGIVLEVDWLLDFPLLWTGNASQPYPIASVDVEQWSGRSTYSDVAALVGALRAAAVGAGLATVRVGLFFVGWGSIYDTARQAWSLAHPELYLNNKPSYSLNHSAAVSPGLHPDAYPYASQPRGAVAGQNFFALLASQWANLSAFLGADALVLRDGLCTFANYDRLGPFGFSASPDAALNAAWTAAFRSMFAEIKRAAPGTFLMGYSSAGSAVGEARIGRFDLEAVVGDGFLDAFIDQSWAGAWEDYYITHMLGWTWQRSTILAHRAAVAGGNKARAAAALPPARHYVLHETFDAYESWNTLAAVPGKLRWGVWAFQGASLLPAGGAAAPADGAYVSWSWSWHDAWMTDAEVSYMAGNVEAAAASVGAQARRAGPRILYNRAGLEFLDGGCGGSCTPADDAGEYIDEETAVISKWAVPSGGVARLEDAPALDAAHPEGYIVHFAAGNLSAVSLAALAAIAASGRPALFTGRASLLHPAVRAALALEVDASAPLLPAGMYAAAATPAALALAPDMPATFSVALPPVARVANGTGEPLLLAFDKNGTAWPILVRAPSGALWWHPTDWLPGADCYGPWLYSNFGSAAPHYLIARYFQSASGIPIRAASGVGWGGAGVALDAWVAAGDPAAAVVLMGNLEGQDRQWGSPAPVVADARTPRSVALEVNLPALGVAPASVAPGACWALTCADGCGVWNATADGASGATLALPPVVLEAFGGHAYRLARC